jgi:NOL1/NOP2/fmu family ribosome biogenesis protein
LVSNEVIQARARILTENTTKWGYTNTVVTNNDPKDFERLNEFFDVIVVDAPCSGEGMFRKDIKARDEWSEENVNICSSRQKRIVMDVWDSLKPGGFLIYSTCTFNSTENEDTISWYLNEIAATYVQLEMPEELVAGRNNIGHYCLPGKTISEGFYIAVLQKEAASPARQRFSRKPLFKVQKDLLDAENYVKLDEALLLNWNDKLLLVPNQLEEKMLHVQAQMRIQKMGLMLGEIAKKGIIPSVELALNPTRLNRTSTIELTEKEALMYLHGDTFPLQGPQGFQIVSYKNEPLGWIKNIGNRFNNLFPKEWRIRMNIQ